MIGRTAAGPRRPSDPTYSHIAATLCLLFTALILGCMSVATNTTLLTNTSHLGTPFSGARGDLHTLACFGKDTARDARMLLLAPVMLLPLVDLPLSFAADVWLLPVDIPMTPGRPPQQIGAGGCRLVGM